MAKRSNEPQPLTLQTLAGTFEASRAVLNTFPIGTISTYTQLQQRLQKIAKDKEAVITLFNALTRLDEHSMALGLTTLVRALDHPLVPRIAHVPKK